MYTIEELERNFERLIEDFYEYFNETIDDEMVNKCEELKGRIDGFCESLKSVL